MPCTLQKVLKLQHPRVICRCSFTAHGRKDGHWPSWPLANLRATKSKVTTQIFPLTYWLCSLRGASRTLISLLSRFHVASVFWHPGYLFSLNCPQGLCPELLSVRKSPKCSTWCHCFSAYAPGYSAGPTSSSHKDNGKRQKGPIIFIIERTCAHHEPNTTCTLNMYCVYHPVYTKYFKHLSVFHDCVNACCAFIQKFWFLCFKIAHYTYTNCTKYLLTNVNHRKFFKYEKVLKVKKKSSHYLKLLIWLGILGGKPWENGKDSIPSCGVYSFVLCIQWRHLPLCRR